MIFKPKFISVEDLKMMSTTTATTPFQSSLHNQNASLSLSSSLSNSHSPLLPFTFTQTQRVKLRVCYTVSVACSISKIHSYGTVNYERRPILKWIALYKRISFMENPELGSASVLNQWENEGNNITKWQLCNVVKKLRKFRKHHRALQIYDWMNNRPERFRMSASDAAIQLDLVARVHGVSTAEGFFLNLANDLKDKRTHGALLNVYVHSRLKEKAESLLDTMRSRRYLTEPLPFNLMMTLYRNLKEYDKVDMLVSEMKEKNIQLEIITYNIWLSSAGYQRSIEKMEQVFEQMSKDHTIAPNWSTFSTMAAMYIKMELFEKAEECLKKVEGRIVGRDSKPFHYLLRMYGNVRNKDKVYHVWNTYKSMFLSIPKWGYHANTCKSMFPSIPKLGYHAIISSLVQMDDIEGAEKLFQEWVSVRPSDDSRLGNLLMGWYVKNGKTDKAVSFFELMTESGGCPNSTTWELLSAAHIADKRIPEALSCLKKAFTITGSKSWKPKPVTLSAFLELCRDQDDTASVKDLIELLWESGHLKDQAYASLIDNDELSRSIETEDITDDIVDSDSVDETEDITDDIVDSDSVDDDDDSQVLFNQLESSF